VAILNPLQWERVNKPPRFRFGYMPPIIPVGDVPAVVVFSPELIAQVTASLSDDELDRYMTVVEAMVGAHLQHDDLPTDVVITLIEDELSDTAPSSLSLVTEIEMKAMDSGIVRVG
jgi:hypothetical protein